MKQLEMERAETVGGLDESDARALEEYGYVLLRGAIPEDLVKAARRAIWRSVGERAFSTSSLVSVACAGEAMDACPELAGATAFMDLLYETPLWAAAESVATQTRLKPAGAARIVLGFPSARANDGQPLHADRIEDGAQVLLVAFLGDLPDADSGNLVVWPGTHRLADEANEEIDLGEPAQITAVAGDALLAHPSLAHAFAQNQGAEVSVAVLFRF